jgi:ubiquinone/menaquinone biosynthesis C-methylase UbiE
VPANYLLSQNLKKGKLKVRDSGMPAEDMWASFFNVELILSELNINSKISDLVEIGCGYGTFTIPSAKKINGNLYAFDIEEGMIKIVKQELKNRHIKNVILNQRDILTQTTGLADNSIDYVMLFNILHHESPDDFLNEAYRILKQDGKLGILHWRSDIPTPRGPDLSIRPKPAQILQWIDKQKFAIYKTPTVIIPYHFGLILSKL